MSVRLPPRVRCGGHPDDRAIVALALPALGALAADSLYSVIDTAFVGHLGRPELGAWRSLDAAPPIKGGSVGSVLTTGRVAR